MGIFGSTNYDYPSWMRDAGQSGYANYGTSLDQMYGPSAYNRAIAQYAENWDQQAGNSPWGRVMGQNGFQGSPNTGLIRAGTMANNRMNTRQMFNQGQLGGYQNQMGMLSGLAPLYHKTYSPGIGQALGGLAAQYIGSKIGGGAGATGGSAQGVSSPVQTSYPANPGLPYTSGGNTGSGASSFQANPGLPYQTGTNQTQTGPWYPPKGLNAYGY